MRTFSNNFDLNTTQNFSLGNTELELAFIYHSPITYGILELDARPEVNLGIQQKFKSGLVVAFNVSDLFNTSSLWHIIANAESSQLYYDWRMDPEGPIYRISFSMPFGNQKLSQQRQRTSGSAEEQGRLN